ncbi:MAG: Hsp20/alpha crystallin family protein [Gemmatimonadaceae bacterium]
MITTLPINSMLDRMVTLSRAMDEAFHKDAAAGNARTTYWVPTLDAWETENAFVVAVDLPGVNAESVEINFERNTLTISGAREAQVKAPESGELRVFFAERAVGSFTRSLRFPQYVEGDKITAQFDRGVLTITVPKAEAAKPRKIAVGTPVAQA